MRSLILDGGAYARTAFQAINKTAAAAGSGDNTEVDGAWVSRKVATGENGELAMSAKLVITYTTTLTAAATLSFGLNFQDSPTASGGDDYGAVVGKTVVATGPSGGGTVTGTVEVDVDLASAREYIRAQITPDLSAGSADSAEWSAALVFFGDGRVPATKAIAKIGGTA